jgi:hypothetical protein
MTTQDLSAHPQPPLPSSPSVSPPASKWAPRNRSVVFSLHIPHLFPLTPFTLGTATFGRLNTHGSGSGPSVQPTARTMSMPLMFSRWSPSDDTLLRKGHLLQPSTTSGREQSCPSNHDVPISFHRLRCRIVWEQKVPVIVMLTREVEGNHVKSDCYWKDGQYGHLQLKLDEQIGATDVASLSRNCGEFNFGSSTVMHGTSEAIIKRVFTFRNLQQPNAPPRKIVHLQYLGWPDLNVPESSRGVLDLIGHVNNALANASPMEEVEQSPVMLHCSAGVGRTGGFILVDSILDCIRRELRQKSKGLGTSSDAMDLDEPEVPSSPVAQHGELLDITDTRGTAPFASTMSLHSDAPDSMRKPSKPSINRAGPSNKQQTLSNTLAEKLADVSAASNPPSPMPPPSAHGLRVYRLLTPSMPVVKEPGMEVPKEVTASRRAIHLRLRISTAMRTTFTSRSHVNCTRQSRYLCCPRWASRFEKCSKTCASSGCPSVRA